MKASVLCIGKPHANAVHAYHDAKRMAHYFLDLGYATTLRADTPADWRADIGYTLIWFSGEYADLTTGALDHRANFYVYDCCRMGARITTTSHSTGEAWCAAERFAYNLPMQGSLFAQAVWTWIQNNSGTTLFEPHAGFNPRAVREVNAQVREVTKGFSNSPQCPVIGEW